MVRKHSIVLDSFWKAQLLGWTCFYAWNFMAQITEYRRHPAMLRDDSIQMGFTFLATLALRPICKRLIHQSSSWIAFEWRAGAWSVVASLFTTIVTDFTLLLFHPIDRTNVTAETFSTWFVIFLWCSMYFGIKQWQEASLEKERLLRAETKVREARLLVLRYQLNPHFLFNSLNAVSTLVLDGDTPAATRMLAQIGDLLRTSLDSEILTEVPLSQEMAFTEQYLAIEQTRLGERLHVELTTSPETLDALVPSMLLQPLAENAVRHGVVPLTGGGKIAIRSSLHKDRLRIIVENTGKLHMETSRGTARGVGLKNTSERLKEHYGKNCLFSLEWQENGNCQVTVELPFHTIPSPQEVQSCGQ